MAPFIRLFVLVSPNQAVRVEYVIRGSKGCKLPQIFFLIAVSPHNNFVFDSTAAHN